MSVVVRTPEGKHRIISKGAPEAIFPRCKSFQLDEEFFPMDDTQLADVAMKTTLFARVSPSHKHGLRSGGYRRSQGLC